jgi:hypothetical protein
MAVSPFDGVNRIRFKGSLDFRFLIFDFLIGVSSQIYGFQPNQKSKIKNRNSSKLSAARSSSPEKAVCYQTSKFGF